MNITYNETNRIFKLDTLHTSYCIGVVDEENFWGTCTTAGALRRMIWRI